MRIYRFLMVIGILSIVLTIVFIVYCLLNEGLKKLLVGNPDDGIVYTMLSITLASGFLSHFKRKLFNGKI